MSKKFVPTAQQRETVGLMIGFGIPEEEVCRLIKNPETGKPINKETLEIHFRVEIETGQTKANAQVGRFIYASITGAPGGITDERARAALAMFWAKMRMNWKETSVHQHEHKGHIEISHVRERIAGKLARLSASEDSDGDPKGSE